MSYWRHRRQMKKESRSFEASLSPTATGALTDGERRIVELSTAGDDTVLFEIRHAFYTSQAPVRQARPEAFEVSIRTPNTSLRVSSQTRWSASDLVITDTRLDRPFLVSLSLSRWIVGGDDLTFTMRASRTEGMAAPWPPSLRADAWGYLAPGEDFTGALPEAGERTCAADSFLRVTNTSPGRAAAWLQQLLDAAGDASSPVGAVDADGLATFEEEHGVALPREVKQFWRWSDGAGWGDLHVMGTDEAFVLDISGRQLLLISTDVGGNAYAIDIERGTATTAPVVYLSGTEEVEAAPSFRRWLLQSLTETGG